LRVWVVLKLSPNAKRKTQNKKRKGMEQHLNLVTPLTNPAQWPLVEQAAAAYNAKSLELFGPTRSLNVLLVQD
jgi:hypothetical protein